MKHQKQIISNLQPLLAGGASAELNELIWQFICYPPKMPLRLHQEQLLQQAEKFSVTLYDAYFSQSDLVINGFIWGTGKHKIMITHGWGSKAADFSDLINALLTLDDVQIIAFDAPGNGSSGGGLSNLLLFVEAVEAIVGHAGQPDILIGHSIGAMANVVALTKMGFTPNLLVSITPLIRLKENFDAMMSAIRIPLDAQAMFLDSFEKTYGFSPAVFNMDDQYQFDASLNHWLVYDRQDMVSPYTYMEAFLSRHPAIKTLQCDGAGHDRVLKSAEMIDGLVAQVREVIK